MKLPKNFGGQGLGDIMGQMQSAMANAKNLEEDLKQETLNIDKGPVKAVFDGTGEIQKITIDPSIVDPEDVAMLEDLIVSCVRAGFETATERRNQRIQGLMPNLPDIPGLT
jgi:DNA-binding YbaB/EbfC family protein